MNWLPEILSPAPSDVTHVDAIIRDRWVKAESLRRAYRHAANSTTEPDPQDDVVYRSLERAFSVACMEVTMWRGMRQQSDRLLPSVKPGSRPIDYQEFIDLALRDANHLEGVFQKPAGITLPKSGIIATICQFHWSSYRSSFFPARIQALAQALRSGCPVAGTIEPHMRSGVFMLFHEYIERFTGDMRFASDADEAGGLLVDACLSLVGTVLQQQADALNDSVAREAREQDDDPSLDSGWFVGVGVTVCRYCGNGDPIGQVRTDVDAGRDECEVLEENEVEPPEETDGWERTVDDEEQESGWTTICRES